MKFFCLPAAEYAGPDHVAFCLLVRIAVRLGALPQIAGFAKWISDAFHPFLPFVPAATGLGL